MSSCIQKMSLKMFVVSLTVLMFHSETLKAEPNQPRIHLKMTTELSGGGFYKWEFDLATRCKNCELKIVILDENLKTEKVKKFVETLQNKKTEISALYNNFDSDYYNRLALMALGILGNESQFFKSKKYFLKETFPSLVTAMKFVKSLYSDQKISPNSQGPTQIKIIPSKIAEKYKLTKIHLKEPEAAALATMGFLIESFQELNNRLRLNQITVDAVDDFEYYLPYIFFGKTKSLVNGTATPMANMYVKSMRQNMKKFELYQR